MACNSKTCHRGAKRIEIWNLLVVGERIWDIFDLAVFKVLVGIIRCSCHKVACNSKTVGHRAK